MAPCGDQKKDSGGSNEQEVGGWQIGAWRSVCMGRGVLGFGRAWGGGEMKQSRGFLFGEMESRHGTGKKLLPGGVINGPWCLRGNLRLMVPSPSWFPSPACPCPKQTFVLPRKVLLCPAPRPGHWHHAPLPRSHPKSPGQDPSGLCVVMLDQSQPGGGTGNQQRARSRVALQPSSPFKAKQVGKQQPNA